MRGPKKAELRCVTPSCIEHIALWGEHNHSVYEKALPDGTTHVCDKCGAHLIEGRWVSRCKACKAVVPAGELVGLFVPHSCKPCLEKVYMNQIRRGARCSSCRKPYVNCYC